MISLDHLTEIGSFGKPHGISGEINAVVDVEYIDFIVDRSVNFVFVEIDGLRVPFEISDIRRRGTQSVLITFADTNSEHDIVKLVNKAIYVEDSALPSLSEDDQSDDEDYGDLLFLYDVVGYKVTINNNPFGEIIDVDDSTINQLIIVATPEGNEYMIPFTEEFITYFDPEEKIIDLELPDGLLDL